MNNNDIIKYYDDSVATYVDSGINERVFHLYKKLLRLGLKKNSNVLELGCGIGTLTFLLSKYIKSGQVEAVDISPKSIEFAKQKIKPANISFAIDDIVTYKPKIRDVDFIILFDVLEHILIENHHDLFRNISQSMEDHTKIIINIPNPAAIEHDRIHDPKSLQIIDQPLPISEILSNIEKNGLALTFFETYGIWVENDYQLLVAEKKKVFKQVSLGSKRTIIQKVRNKFERIYVKLRYPFR